MTTGSTPVILFDQVSKRYRLGRAVPNVLRLFRRSVEEQSHHWAVRDISFSLEPGDSLGIVGPNGAGKTTILKLLSRVTQPTVGQIRSRGRFSALIELGAGFHPDLTGRENVYLNGAILGMQRAELHARFDDIVSFAGIETYLDTPVKRYSSGMYARLGFAIAAHVDPDILLVDEVLAVGDYAFRMKCYERMDALRSKGTTLIFVSHNMHDVRRVCQRGMVLHRGQIAYVGTAAEATIEHTKLLRTTMAQEAQHARPTEKGLAQRIMTQAAQIERVDLVTADGASIRLVKAGQEIVLLATVRFAEDAQHPVFACTIFNEQGEVVYDTTTRKLEMETPDFGADETWTVHFRLAANLVDGVYRIATDLAYADLSCYYDYLPDAVTFAVSGGAHAAGVANLFANVSFEEKKEQRDRDNHQGSTRNHPTVRPKEQRLATVIDGER